MTSSLLSCTPKSLMKRVYSIRNVFAPKEGANSFLLEKIPFFRREAKQITQSHFPWHTSELFFIGIYSNRKEFAPIGSINFLFG